MKAILGAAVSAALAFNVATAGAEATSVEKLVVLNIQPQALSSALDRWAEQSGVQVVSPSWQIAERLSAPSLNGTFGVQAALDQLLAGTPLTYEWLSEGAVSIRERVMPPGGLVAAEQARAVAPQIRVAEAARAEDSAQALPAEQQSETADRKKFGAYIDEIVVTGSRLRRRTEEGPAPVTVFDRKTIDRLGVANTADVLNYLPQQAFAYSDGTAGFASARKVQLRGLGVGTTLILINGRRTVTSALVGRFGFFDLNTIPLSAVERIEVLSDSASAVYGADAVGGVLNVILKSDIQEPNVDVYFGKADQGADERRASVAFGLSTDRFRTSVVLDAFDREFLKGEDRSFYADQDFRRFGSDDTRVLFANPGNVCTRNGSPLPGLSSSCAAIPSGSTGVGLTLADFSATVGESNLDSNNRYRSVVPEAQRIGGMALLEFDITENAALFGEFLYADREDTGLLPPSTMTANVPAANPFNPFDVPVAVSYLFTGVGPRKSVSDAEAFRGVAGARGVFGSWDWEVSMLSTKEDGTNFNENAVDTARVNASLAAADPQQVLNVFQDGPGGSATLLQSLLAVPRIDHFSSKAMQGSAFIRGSVFKLPAGDVQAVVGAEHRSEDLLFSTTFTVDDDRDSSAGYAELRFPIVDPTMSIAAVQRLSVTLAGRYDDYSDVGGTFNPQYGIEWRPGSSLLLRASYGSSFRPPSLFELNSPATSIQGIATDPRRNNERVPVQFIQGGNENLEPEESDSLSAGIAIVPPSLPGFEFTATYWSVEQVQRVVALPANLVLANEILFPERVVRAEATATDVAAGLPGRLMSVNASSVNFGRLDTNGIDLQAVASIATTFGEFAPSLSATWVHEYDAVDLPATPAVDRVGVANPLGTIPKWRAVGTLGWSLGGVGLAMTGRYASSHADTDVFGALNGRTVGSETLFDMQATLRLDALSNSSSWLSGFVVRAGALNVFDKEPRFSEVSGFGIDFSQADLRRRFGYISVSKTF